MNSVLQWAVWELELRAAHSFRRPFADVRVQAKFTAPSGRICWVDGFHTGGRRRPVGTDPDEPWLGNDAFHVTEDGTWSVRFAPDEPGEWHYSCSSLPHDDGLTAQGTLIVNADPSAKGFLIADRSTGWGFRWKDGTPVFLMGDNLFNIFAYAHCGYDARAVLEHRKAQGFNVVRARAHCSNFHEPDRLFYWMNRDCWPWGGTAQSPRFDEFNLDYFGSVDQVVRLCEELGMGIDLILEAWMFEFPFNDRARFTAEDEELWIRYIVARYGAFRSIWMWTIANEHAYYPNGHRRMHPRDVDDTLPDRWAARLARLVKSADPHGHPVGVHTLGDWAVSTRSAGGDVPRRHPGHAHIVGLPGATIAERLQGYPEIDVLGFQEWGICDERAWTGAGIDEGVRRQAQNAKQVTVLAEYGIESVPGLPMFAPRRFLLRDHTRRGGWRGCFSGVFIMCGFENSWGHIMTLQPDADGAADMVHLRRFFEEIAPFPSLRVCDGVVDGLRTDIAGGAALCLANPTLDLIAVYLPVGGGVSFRLPSLEGFHGAWFDPRTGTLHPIDSRVPSKGLVPPGGTDADDWAMVLSRKPQYYPIASETGVV